MPYRKFVQIAISVFIGTTILSDTAFGQDAMSAEEKQAINTLIETYIMENPEVILKSIEGMRERAQLREEEEAKKNIIALKDEIMYNPADPIAGNPDGDLTVVEFFDYRCGYCKQFFTELSALIEEDENLRVVFKELPILGPASELAAKAALAATEQGLYLEFHSAMMNAKGSFTERRVFAIAEEVGLDIPRLRKDMESSTVQTVLDDAKNLADQLSVSGTPAIIVGSNLVRGAISKDRLKAMVTAARQ